MCLVYLYVSEVFSETATQEKTRVCLVYLYVSEVSSGTASRRRPGCV